jgi:protein-disulfide isomerase
MKDKFVLGIIIVTILLFVGGAFLITKKDTKTIENTKNVLEIRDDDYIKGNKNASVTIVEYSDFECPACGAYYPLIKELSEIYKNDVRFVIRYFPLMGHKNGLNSALAVEASSKQGKYWEMHDLLFGDQKVWGGKESADPTIFENYAKQIGLNIDQFNKDVNSKEIKDRVNRDLASGKEAGITGTPTFFLNGKKIPNPKNIEDFKTFIDAAILKK